MDDVRCAKEVEALLARGRGLRPAREAPEGRDEEEAGELGLRNFKWYWKRMWRRCAGVGAVPKGAGGAPVGLHLGGRRVVAAIAVLVLVTVVVVVGVVVVVVVIVVVVAMRGVCCAWVRRMSETALGWYHGRPWRCRGEWVWTQCRPAASASVVRAWR